MKSRFRRLATITFARAGILASAGIGLGLMNAQASAQESFRIEGDKGTALTAQAVTEFDEPWAMTFLPDGTMLVTTKPGKLFHVTQNGEQTEVGGMWDVAYRGQGGLGDVVLHPDFASNSMVYISYAETLDNGATSGAVVVRAELDMGDGAPKLTGVDRVWVQEPKVPGSGHFAHRIAFGPDGKMYITSGDRQKQMPAQDMTKALGKIIRLNDDGTVPPDNPWNDNSELEKTFWSMGHRNPLGIAFDAEGRLWAHEMGPRHGDELNLIEPSKNYGWPIVSYGDNYSGVPIPDHDTRPQFEAPKAWWVPAISPAGLTLYSGDQFTAWEGDALIGGLSSRALVHIEIDGTEAREAERFSWGERVRETEQGPDGALWVLEDGNDGRLLKLTPAS